MCVVSMILDHYHDKWWERIPHEEPTIEPYIVSPTQPNPEPRITDEEIREFRDLLRKARDYDKKNNEPHCELESKKETLRKIAEALGFEINFDEESSDVLDTMVK